MTTSDWAGSLENTPGQEKIEQGLRSEIKTYRSALIKIKEHVRDYYDDDHTAYIDLKLIAGEALKCQNSHE